MPVVGGDAHCLLVDVHAAVSQGDGGVMRGIDKMQPGHVDSERFLVVARGKVDGGALAGGGIDRPSRVDGRRYGLARGEVEYQT